ncbi:hypothetical protein D3C87_259900 [compost metagenome]
MKKLTLAGLAAILLSTVVACSKNSSPSTPPSNPELNETKTDWQKDFPAHWWKEVPRKDARSWEILPQDAGYMEVILSKRNELGLLSNFADASVVFHGVCYPTIEAFWQMMKYPETPNDVRWTWAKNWKYTREQVSQMNGYSAKSAGGYANFLMDKNNANWITFEGREIPFALRNPGEHYRLILEVLIEKVRQNPGVLDVLLKTKTLTLKPDHGISDESPREWHYNLLWMDIRKDLQDGNLSLQTAEDTTLKTCKSQKF